MNLRAFSLFVPVKLPILAAALLTAEAASPPRPGRLIYGSAAVETGFTVRHPVSHVLVLWSYYIPAYIPDGLTVESGYACDLFISDSMHPKKACLIFLDLFLIDHLCSSSF
jgi:hypothetical protein